MMSWTDSLTALFKNDLTIVLRSDVVVFQNELLEIKLKPFIVVSDKRIVLAIGEETTTAAHSKKVEFLTDASLADKERFEYLQTFLRFGLQKAMPLKKTFLRPAVTIKDVTSVASLIPNPMKFFSDAAVSAGARSVAFSK
jgi:hypothetical protein